MGWRCLQVLLGACLLFGKAVRGERADEVIPRDDTRFLIQEHEKARARVDEVFEAGVDVGALMCSPPSQVAFVEKSKHIRIPDSLDPTDTSIGRYRAAGVPIFDSCQIWISERWEFVYLLQPKSSAKMVMRAVRKDICKKAACLREEFRLVELDEIATLADTLSRYFVFTFVRNPFTRALSTYSMFHQNFLYRTKEDSAAEPTERCGYSFDEFSRDVGGMYDMCEDHGCCSYLEARGSWWPEFVNIHIGDHSHCMFLPNGEPIADYVGLTEFFDAAWVDIMNTLLRRHNGARRLADAVFDEPRRSTGGGAGAPAPTPAYVAGQVTIWHAVPQDGAAGQQGGAGGVSYVTQSATVEDLRHACNSTRTLQFMNQTTVHNLARQYALDLVRLGYI